MYTAAKERFLETFNRLILEPRGMGDYRMQFTGPTGTNAVEAAMKLARKVTGRNNIISFTNGFHGCSIGALAATGNQHHRGGSGISLTDVSRMRSEEHTSELQSLMRISYAVFCLKNTHDKITRKSQLKNTTNSNKED